jgi:hypothetical protein
VLRKGKSILYLRDFYNGDKEYKIHLYFYYWWQIITNLQWRKVKEIIEILLLLGRYKGHM